MRRRVQQSTRCLRSSTGNEGALLGFGPRSQDERGVPQGPQAAETVRWYVCARATPREVPEHRGEQQVRRPLIACRRCCSGCRRPSRTAPRWGCSPPAG
eukprot:6385970-Prymnesium_polylepis.1